MDRVHSLGRPQRPAKDFTLNHQGMGTGEVWTVLEQENDYSKKKALALLNWCFDFISRRGQQFNVSR